ncbi:hypothetical protein SEVIR_2G088925v4 [Setaria viridis]
MDDVAWRRWYESFLPPTDDDDEPRFLHCYTGDDTCFLLAGIEPLLMANKAGVLHGTVGISAGHHTLLKKCFYGPGNASAGVRIFNDAIPSASFQAKINYGDFFLNMIFLKK